MAILLADAAPGWGPSDAPVTVIEFGDFLCPYCRAFALYTEPSLRKYQYNGPGIYKGRGIRFLFINLPAHGNEEIAQGGICADRQGQFIAYHDKMFTDWDLAFHGNGAIQAAQGLANDNGSIDMDAFNACMNDPTSMAQVDEDVTIADTIMHVSGTPMFIIGTASGGQKLIGGLSYDSLASLLNAAFAALPAS